MTYGPTGAVKAIWRKKTIKASDFKSLYQAPRYILSNDGTHITYAFLCVMRIDGTFPSETQPCSESERRRLQKEYNRRLNITEEEETERIDFEKLRKEADWC